MLEKFKQIYDEELSRYDSALEFDVLNSREVRAFVYEVCKNCLKIEADLEGPLPSPLIFHIMNDLLEK